MPSPGPSIKEQLARAMPAVRHAWASKFTDSSGQLRGLAAVQQESLQDRGPSKKLYTVPVTFTAPKGNALRDAVLDAVRALGDGGMEMPVLEAADVGAEWVGIRPRGAEESDVDGEGDAFEGLGAREKLQRLSESMDGEGTILLVHGGAFFQNGLGRTRPSAARLARESGCRVLVLDYRLSPQHAFPSPILDLLLCYLSLLHPPPGSAHTALAPSSIVLAGESSGANIILGFTQLLLHLQSHPHTPLRFYDTTLQIPIPVPAGLALPSAQPELAYCFPSWQTNLPHDLFPTTGAPFNDPAFPPDHIWPTSPPRETLYCPASLFHHPMVAPCTATSWRGAPPMYIALGQECLADAIGVVAQTAVGDGVSVVWEQYEGMPHCWMVVLPGLPQAERLWRRWGRVCREMVRGEVTESKGVWVAVEGTGEREVDMGKLSELSAERAREMTREWAKGVKVYYGREKGKL